MPICTCAPEIELSPDFKNNVKIMCVYSNLVGTASRNYNPLVINFLTNFSDGLSFNPGDVTFDLKSLDNTESATCTRNEYNDICTITLNQSYINNRAPVELAKTMMHEILHAKIFHSKLVAPDLFETMFLKYLGETTGNFGTDEHQFILNYYIPPMIRFLKDFDSSFGNSAPDDFYKAIAISGLGLKYSASELEQIMTAQNFFRSRGLNCP